jgi:hypothetical protein
MSLPAANVDVSSLLKDKPMAGEDQFDLDHTQDIATTESEGNAAIAAEPGRHAPL